MSNRVISVRGTDYILTHVAQPRVNGRKCNQYEVRSELEGQDAYQQHGDVYVPVGDSVQYHLERWAAVDDFDDDYGYAA